LSYISLAVQNSELIIVTNMETFTRHYCYAKKQKQGKVFNYKDLPAPEETSDNTGTSIMYEVDERILPEEDDI
jgi:hypothetical protein